MSVLLLKLKSKARWTLANTSLMLWTSLLACAQPYYPDSVATMGNSLGLVELHW